MASSSDTTPTSSSTTTLAPHGPPPRASTTEPTDPRSGPSTGTSTTTEHTLQPDVTVEALLLTIRQVVRDEIAAAGPGRTALPPSSLVTGPSVGPPSLTCTTRTDAPLTGPGTSTGKLCHSTHILRPAKPTPVAAHHHSKKPTPVANLTNHTGTYIWSLHAQLHTLIHRTVSVTVCIYICA